MSLLPDATDGLYAAFATGLFGVLLWWLQRRPERSARVDAWQRRVEELTNELRTANAERVADLQGQVDAERAESREKDAEIRRKDAEIRRLNGILNRQRGEYDRE